MTRWIHLAGWLAFAALLVLVVAIAGDAGPAAQGLAAVSILVMAAHAVGTLGLADAAIFAGLCLAITFAVENIGVATGFPFGRYHFAVGADLPHVGAIPIIVGPLYFGMGWGAWTIAHLILGTDPRRPGRSLGLWAAPALAAVTMVQWDAVMDPPYATIAKDWVWHDGGYDFGVPLTNFLGWALTTWLYFQATAIVFASSRERPLPPLPPRAVQAIPVLLYLAAGLAMVPQLVRPDSIVIDGGGGHWSAAAIRGTSVILMLVTMLPASLLALLRLFGPPHLTAPGPSG